METLDLIKQQIEMYEEILSYLKHQKQTGEVKKMISKVEALIKELKDEYKFRGGVQ